MGPFVLRMRPIVAVGVGTSSRNRTDSVRHRTGREQLPSFGVGVRRRAQNDGACCLPARFTAADRTVGGRASRIAQASRAFSWCCGVVADVAEGTGLRIGDDLLATPARLATGACVNRWD